MAGDAEADRQRQDSPETGSGTRGAAGGELRLVGECGQVLYTPEQAAVLLQVRPSWLRKKAAARAVPCTFVGKHLRFSAADVAAIVAAGHQEPQPRSRGRRPAA
jgi:excisionase family DNA binding protein